MYIKGRKISSSPLCITLTNGGEAVALRALFFDFGGTLDIYPHVRENSIAAAGSMLSILKASGLKLSRAYTNEEFFSLVSKNISPYRVWKHTSLIELPELTVWQEYILKDEPDRMSLDAETAAELTYLIDNGFHTRSVRPEVREALESCARFGLKLGVISNVLSSLQVPRDLERHGIAEFFDPVVTSACYGRLKPHPSIFHHAASMAGVDPSEAIYIGNSPKKDVKGSRDAGFMASVLIHYQHTIKDDLLEKTHPDFTITNLMELPPIVEQLLSEEAAAQETL